MGAAWALQHSEEGLCKSFSHQKVQEELHFDVAPPSHAVRPGPQTVQLPGRQGTGLWSQSRGWPTPGRQQLRPCQSPILFHLG